MFKFFKPKKKAQPEIDPVEKTEADPRLLFALAKGATDPEMAVNLYTDAIAIEKKKDSPDRKLLSEIYQFRGELYLSLGVALLSSSDFMHSLEYDPDNAISHNNLGIWHTVEQFATPDHDKALKHIEKAISLAPDRLDFQMSRAVIKAKLGDAEAAKAELEALYAKGLEDARVAMERFL